MRDPEPAVTLPGLTMGEQVVDDYASISMSLRAHPLALLRPMLSERRHAQHRRRCATLADGDRFTLAGLVLVRQRPGTASGVVFVTIEDEFGIANLVVWPRVFEAHRRIVMGARLLGVGGRVQREGIVIHLVAERLWDWSADLDRIADLDGHSSCAQGRGDEVRTDPGDRRVRGARSQRHAPPSRHGPAGKQPYDRSRIVLDRPPIRIHSRDFH